MHSSLLEDIAAATRLREGAEGVKAVLRAVYRDESQRLADVARAARLPLPVATAVRRELEHAGVLTRAGGLALTDTGRAWLRDDLGFAPPLRQEVPRAPAPLTGVLAEACRALSERLESAPAVDNTLDQAPCQAETAIRRAALLYQSGALEGARLAILGDDDSISLAVGLLGRAVAGRPVTRAVTVFELDPNRLAFLANAEAGLEITLVAHDLRDPLPERYRGNFDSFQTDPPYTLEGARLFLGRGVEALEAGRGLGLLSFGHTAPPDRLAVQRAMADLGLAITALHPSFNAYGGAAILGGVSDLYELAAQSGTEALPRWEGPLYTADVSTKIRAYSCKACGRKVTLGKAGAPATIEALKRAGCPSCGGTVFARVRPGTR